MAGVRPGLPHVSPSGIYGAGMWRGIDDDWREDATPPYPAPGDPYDFGAPA